MSFEDGYELSGDLTPDDGAEEIVGAGCAVEGEPSVRWQRVLAEFREWERQVMAERAQAEGADWKDAA